MNAAHSSRQSGLTIMESMLSLALMATVTVGLAQTFARNQDSLAVSSTASQLAQVRAAASSYVQDNFTSLETAAAAGPVAIPISTLIAANYLPPSYQNRNDFGQAHQVYVHRRAAGVLESLVVTTGGHAMTLVQGGKVALLLKAAGAYVPVGSADAIGARSTWRTPLSVFIPGGAPLPSGGVAAYALQRAVEGPSGALMRINTGNPVDNQMATDLDMTGHNILNVNQLTASSIATNTLTIGGQALSLTDAQTLAALSAASCGTGYALSKSIGSNFSCVPISAVPSGAIAAFSGGCPAGWNAYTAAAGRVLVGAGSGYNVGDTGGANSVTLTVSQMPQHSHHMFANAQQGYNTIQNYPDAAPNRGAAGSSSGASYNIGANTYGLGATQGATEKVGGNQPFDNRQPYLALNYCQKQ